mgnify:CR=1 FL=1
MCRLSAFASVVLAAAMLLLQGLPPAAAQQGLKEQEIRTLVEGLRNGTVSASFASDHQFTAALDPAYPGPCEVSPSGAY